MPVAGKRNEVPAMSLLLSILLAGVGATALTDAWTWLRRRLFAVAPPDYGLVGRWFAHMAGGRLRHDAIARSAPVRGERVLGWTVHYAIGVAYAALMPLLAGPDWFARPTLLPALLVGVATVAAPFLLMQPAMGAGFAASRTPRPWAARMHSLVMHAVFGAGLYLAAL
jgi:hypothetical protein